MKIINKYLYNTIFWISRIFSISVFGTCLCIALHTKYIFYEQCTKLFVIIFEILDKFTDSIFLWIMKTFIGHMTNLKFDITFPIFVNLIINSKSIDLLLITLAVILILGIIIAKFIEKEYQYSFIVGIINFIVYLTMYLIYESHIMIVLAISTPIIFALIILLNKICPSQKIIALIPIIGEIFCTKKIINHMFNKISKKNINISLLIVALVISNTICFLFLHKADNDFENRIMENWTYSIRTYQDKMIISGDGELIVIDKNSNINHIKDDIFFLEDFVVDKNKQQIYICYIVENSLLVLDANTLNIIKEINTLDYYQTTRICCNNDFSKIIFIMESKKISVLIDLNTYNIKYIKGVSPFRDGLIYNKYRNCFLISFHDENSFLQEIDIENKKIRKIKADKDQGYIAISEPNKEIYVAFHQQGRIGVYDAQTMKLKRKIKSNYTVKDITYDEELNILIAPSYFTGYVDIFLMDGSDTLLTREFVGYELREGCFDPKKENLYVCSMNGLYRKKIDIKKLIEEHSNNKNTIL